MNRAEFLFDEMVLSVFGGGGDFKLAWNAYRDPSGRSADALCSLLWISTAAVPSAIAEIAGYPQAKTYGELAHALDRPKANRGTIHDTMARSSVYRVLEGQ
ncbi:MAG: hypothetical protein WAL20_08525 [Rhodomicrobium sp.]